MKQNFDTIVPDLADMLPEYYNLSDGVLDISERQFETLYGKKMPKRDRPDGRPFNMTSMLGETRDTFIGKQLLKMVEKGVSKIAGDDIAGEDNPNLNMMKAMINEMPLRTFGMFTGANMPKYFTEALLLMLNGKLLKGLGMMLKK